MIKLVKGLKWNLGDTLQVALAGVKVYCSNKRVEFCWISMIQTTIDNFHYICNISIYFTELYDLQDPKIDHHTTGKFSIVYSF